MRLSFLRLAARACPALSKTNSSEGQYSPQPRPSTTEVTKEHEGKPGMLENHDTPIFITLGGPQAHGHSARNRSHQQVARIYITKLHNVVRRESSTTTHYAFSRHPAATVVRP